MLLLENFSFSVECWLLHKKPPQDHPDTIAMTNLLVHSQFLHSCLSHMAYLADLAVPRAVPELLHCTWAYMLTDVPLI